MRIDEVRELNDDEISQQIGQHEMTLMNLRFQRGTMQLQDVTEIRKTRRSLSRLMTVIQERKITKELTEKKEKGE